MTKQEARQFYKLKRQALFPKERAGYDALILEHLKTLPWLGEETCHVYLPISKNQEPDTLLFIDWIQKEFPKIRILVSKSHPQDGTMTHYLFNSSIELLKNKWGIPEPSRGKQISEQEIDIVIMPMIISDIQGNRVGYGKGFYDRFLSGCRPHVQKIGICFFPPIAPIEGLRAADIPLDKCISPAGIFVFRQDKSGGISNR